MSEVLEDKMKESISNENAENICNSLGDNFDSCLKISQNNEDEGIPENNKSNNEIMETIEDNCTQITNENISPEKENTSCDSPKYEWSFHLNDIFQFAKASECFQGPNNFTKGCKWYNNLF